ncbi:hypothetical protein N8370_04415 [Amylibacter sp.]|nr:hypothetical protein [Amylibacter sp.]
MSIKCTFILSYFIVVTLLVNPTNANEIDYIVDEFDIPITKKIDSFFNNYSNKSKVHLVPKINGKSRYAFTISKKAYNYSKIFSDTSDLYYLSDKFDNNMALYPNKLKNIEFRLSKNNIKFTYSQNFLPNINTSIFFQMLEQSPYGLMFDKDFIFMHEGFGNLNIQLSKGEYPLIETKIVNLMNKENSELYVNFSHEVKSNEISLGASYTWFELVKNFDLSADFVKGIETQYSKIYLTPDYDTVKFDFGVQKFENNSDLNLFFNLRIDNILKHKKLKSSLIMNSLNDTEYDKKLSLKFLRKRYLDSYWRKRVYFN